MNIQSRTGACLKAFARAAFAVALLATIPAGQARATTLASFDVTGGFLYLPFAGTSTFLSTGSFSGAADPRIDPSAVRPVSVSAKVTADLSGLGAVTLVDRRFGPVMASVDQAIAEAMSMATMLSGLASSVADDIGDYLALSNVASLADPVPSYGAGAGTPLPPGFDFSFKYTGGLSTTSATVSGSYLMQVTTAAPAPTLASVLNQVIMKAGAPIVIPDALQTGTFSASFEISAVPLPSALPLLGAGLVLLLVIGARRRRA